MNRVVGKPEILAEMNRALILDHLRKCGPQSRAELSRTLGLSFPSVSANVETLLKHELISVAECGGSEDAGAGRRPLLFRYNAEWGYIASIDLGRSRVRMMLHDVGGRELNQTNFRLVDIGDDELLDEIGCRFLSLLDASSVPLEKLRCVSIAMPGILSEKSARLELAPFLSETLRTNRLDTYLANRYGVRTCVGNAVNLAAIAEKWQGVGEGYSDIAYVDCAVGLGCALILNGELVTGFNGAAGEIGYMLPGLAFRRKTFDEEGVLEKILAGSEVERRMAMLSLHPEVDMRELFEGEEKLRWAPYLEDIRDYLAMALVNLTAVINPEVIIVGGGFGQALMRHSQTYFEAFLRAHVPFAPKLLKSNLDENAALQGAAAYALRLIHDEQSALC